MSKTIFETEFPDLKLVNRGKVRDIYDLGDSLLIVTTDRLSAFDVILPTPIPDKGKVLNNLSLFWFEKTADIVPNHVITADPDQYPEVARKYSKELAGRSMLVKKAKPLPVECIIRGYISGSGWKEYKKSGTVCSLPLPEGLLESQKLPEPIYTPSTKAEIGEHDENISFEETVKLLGPELAERVREVALAVYLRGSEYAAGRGIIIADTKMEFGLLDGELIIIDELMTPDSSRFWRAETYKAGEVQESLDKQYIRNYLESLDWDKSDPGPELPPEVAREAARRYAEIVEILKA
ncbi:MAG: phosphoribosylaminoimidazolesuccinocarboxamide synthase [Deltaproteobacteria bacterium]|nr:MAG: phosphoribosylaminoimidazolesuccinocarboxamide synthase [Deltaproteobacteria bacterium]